MASSNSFNKSSQDISDCSSTSTKYGDSDLASKRRKGSREHLHDGTNDLDSVNLESSLFNSRRLNNSMELSEIERGSISPRTSDYHTDLLSPVNNPSSKNTRFVSPTPSGTSCGFENTFRILEKQIQTNRNRRMYLRRISEEYIPDWNSLAPANSDSVTKGNFSHDREDPPSFLELELAAMQRIKDQLQKIPEFSKNLQRANATANETAQILNHCNAFEEDCSAAELLAGGDATIDVELGYPEYVYHIAKGKDGRKYLRVVRSLLLDKVLCGNRVSQMTRTYDDIEAVTHLLGEKEKDLELTVQIGKELLQQNNRLENRITELEAELKCSNEDRAQLLHDLHQKNELIAVLTSDVDDGSESDTPTVSKSITLDLMQRKISSLQDENKSLKLEASLIVKKTDEVEEKERKLMEDITTQLNSTNMEFDGISLELERMKEENRFQHEQIISLTSRLAEAELRLHQLTSENDEQVSLLSITKENQNMLTTELAEFKVRYQEVLSLLQEAQEQLRKQRKKVQPQGRSTFIPGMGLGQTESLHSELMESSMYSDNSLDSGISADRMIGPGTIPSYSKVFETVHCGTRSGQYSDCTTQLGAMSLSSISQTRMTAVPFLSTSINSSIGSYHRPSSVYSGSNYPSYENSSMGVKTMSCESLASHSEDGYPTQPTGVPGAPGAKDLEAALKRLTHGEVLARRAMLSHAPAGTYTYDESQNTAPLGLRTPDSIMSTGSGSSGMISNLSGNHWRLPEKLQIVKPMEGSQTLHHWSRLATPTLSGLLEERPGVKIRGGRGLEDLGLQIYSLSDVEEDIEDYPGKQFQASGCIYTYTNSTVMHPDDGTIGSEFLSHSQLSSRIASNTTSRQSSCPPTPHGGLSRRNSCSTFSVHTGLASMLNERGIKAVTPSAINTPAGPNFSPTVTPCNSPEGSPTRSISPEPLFGILSSGADLIRRKLMGEVERPTRSHIKQQKILLSRLEKRALRSLRLVEKVESVGLENIIATQPSVRSQLASGIASRSASPMAQLSNLRNGPLDDLQFDRSQIRAVLSKGLSNDSIKSLTESDTGISGSCETSESTLPSAQSSPMAITSTTTTTSISAQSEVTSAADTDIRLKHMQRQKSRRNLKNGIGGQRPDLGTVGGRVRSDLGKVKATTNAIGSVNSPKQNTSEEKTTQSITQSFVGSVSSIFFGRKGGWF